MTQTENALVGAAAGFVSGAMAEGVAVITASKSKVTTGHVVTVLVTTTLAGALAGWLAPSEDTSECECNKKAPAPTAQPALRVAPPQVKLSAGKSAPATVGQRRTAA